MLWDFCKGLFVKVGITGVWSEVGAITTGLIVIALIDVLFCMFIGLVIRKFIVLKSDRLPQREKAKSFISVLL